MNTGLGYVLVFLGGGLGAAARHWVNRTAMSLAGPDYPAAEAMCRFNLSHDLIVRVLNETVSGWEGQDIRSWKK